MDRDRFQAELQANGFGEIVIVERDPDVRFDVHTHPFEARALILDGEISIETADGVRCYGVGDIFHLPAGLPHAETCGHVGVRYLVGRK